MEDYRIRVLSPDGTEKHVRELDPPAGTPLYLVGGPRRMEVGPLGDCREATFEGDPATLGIGPRDTVQMQYRTGTGPWLNKYAGTAVITGSARSEVGRYKLQGFRYRRLTEVEVRTLLPEADLGAQVRQLFTDVIASSQLGSTLQAPTADTIPDLNVTSAAIQGNFWPAAKLIDERLKGRSRQTRTYLNPDGSTQAKDVNPDWGVNADLRPVFGYPTGTLVIDEATFGVEIDGLDTDSSTLVTDVRVIFTRTMTAQFLLTEVGGQDGEGGTTISTPARSTAPRTIPVPVAPRTFGEAWRGLPLPTSAELFTVLPGASVSVRAFYFSGPVDPMPPVTVTGDPASLWDGTLTSGLTLAPPGGNTVFLYYLTVHVPPGTPVPDGFRLVANGASLSGLTVTTPTGSMRMGTVSAGAPPMYVFPDVVRSEHLPAIWADGATVEFVLAPFDRAAPLLVSEAALMSVNHALVEASATPLARIPTLNPVTARLPGWNYSPAATAQLTLRDPLGAVVESRELPIELLVYDTDDDGELYTEVRCGQRDEAEALSFTSAIASRDQNATTDAVQAST